MTFFLYKIQKNLFIRLFFNGFNNEYNFNHFIFFNYKNNFYDFYNQYILFSLSIGENRITNSDLAHFGISDRLSIRGVIGHFKFIHIYLLSTFLISILFYEKKLFQINFL